MQRVLSTYLFVNRKLTAALVGEVARAKVSAIELFCSRGHFDYGSAEDARELASWLAGNNLTLHSIHSPTTPNSLSQTRKRHAAFNFGSGKDSAAGGRGRN